MTNQIIKLSPGSDLLVSIKEFANQYKLTGFIASIVGNLSAVRFQCPGRTNPVEINGNLEIISLNGTFSPEKVHLHLSFSDSECKVWGGHLENGTKVLKGAEILLILNETNQVDTKGSDYIHLSNTRVEIAVLPNCPWSTRALRILDSNKIPYSKVIIDTDQLFNQIQNRTGVSTFPQIFVDNKFIGGYQEFSDLYNSGNLSEIL